MNSMEYKDLGGGSINDSISIYNCDCMDLLKQTPDNYYSLAIVDPPYGIDIAKWDKIDMKPKPEYFAELFRVSKNQIIWGANYFDLPHNEAWICWDKTYKYNQKLQVAEFELAWSSFEHKSKFIRFTYCGNFYGWEKPRANYQKLKNIHITQKPIEIYEWMFKTYAEPNQKILDTHLGSGSIAIAIDNVNKIEKMNLTLTACELDPDYFKAAMKRIEQQTAQQTIF